MNNAQLLAMTYEHSKLLQDKIINIQSVLQGIAYNINYMFIIRKNIYNEIK